MGVALMRPAFNLEPNYRVTMLTREKWTGGSATPLVIKGLVWFTDGSTMMGGTGAGVYGQFLGTRLSIPLGKHATVFQAEVYAILACVYEIETQRRPQKYVCICSDSQVALKELQAAETMSPLVQQCQKVLNDISNWHTVGLYWVPGHAGVCGNEITNELTMGGSNQKFIEPVPSLGVSRWNINNKIKCWMDNQHLAMWHGPCNTQTGSKIDFGP